MSTNTVAALSKGAENFLRLKSEYGIYEGAEVVELVDAMPSTTDLVSGLIPPRSVNLLVGDSGIGKSPLGYQLGMSVASGTPFLGMPARSSKVLLVDYENSLVDARWIMEQQRRHLGLAEFPHTFQLWPMHMRPMQSHVEGVIATFAPDLVIIDSLRSFSPAMESDSTTTVAQIRRLRYIAAESGTAFLLIHHVKKNNAAAASLDEGHVMDWLLRTAGVRALINQTDVRLAVARREQADTLTLRGHFRTRGEIGPFLLSRKWSGENGEPLGYERMIADPASIQNAHQESCFARLPEAFSFKEARLANGKSHESANLFLHKLIRLGLLRKTAFGQYCKAGCEAAGPDSQQVQSIQ